MTETLVGLTPPSSKDPTDPPSAAELAAAKELVRQARAQGVALTLMHSGRATLTVLHRVGGRG